MPRPTVRLPAELLAELRLEKGFVDYESFAAATGLSERTVRRLQSKAVSNPKSGTIRCVAEGLGMTVAELLARIADYWLRTPGKSDLAVRSTADDQERVADQVMGLTHASVREASPVRDQVRDAIIAYNLRGDKDRDVRQVVQKARQYGEATGLLRLLDRDIEQSHERLTGLHLKRAAVCLILGQPAKARESIRTVLAASPHDVEAELLSASLQRMEGDLAGAEDTCRKVLGAADKPAQRHAALTLLGLVQGDRGNYGDAEAAHTDALAIASKSGDMMRQAAESHRLIAMMRRRQVMNRMGSEKVVKADLAPSRTHWAAGLRLYRQLNDRIGILNLLDNIAVGHMSTGNLRRAQTIYTRLIAKHHALRHRPGEAAAYGNLGLVHGQQGRYASAITMIHRAARIFRRIGWVENIARAHANIAQCYTLWERNGLAIKHWQKAKHLFEDAGMTKPAEACAANLRRLGGDDAETPYMA